MSHAAYSPTGKKLRSVPESLLKKGRLRTRVLSDSRIRTADLVGSFGPGSRNRCRVKNTDVIHKLPIHGHESVINAGFKKKLMEIDVDETDTIVRFHAIIDIFYMPPSYLTDAKPPFKLGSAEVSGEVLADEGGGDRLWETSVKGTCLYTKRDIEKLPKALLEARIGPGAFITMVTQTLFGTKEGLKILGLERYNVLEETSKPRPFDPLDNQFAPESNQYSPRYNSHEWYQYLANPLDIRWATPAHYRD